MENWVLILLLIMVSLVSFTVGSYVAYKKVLSDINGLFQKVMETCSRS